MTQIHTPVLLPEVIELLDPKPGEFFIDGTVDGGGHAREIAKRVSPGGTLLGLDWDAGMLESAMSNVSAQGGSASGGKGQLSLRRQSYGASATNVILVHGNYADLPEILRKRKLGKADGLLLDLGLSSLQLEQSGRGFSFTRDEPLLMTYDEGRRPAWQILKELREEELADVIHRFGEERYARRIARAIKARAKESVIRTTAELTEVVRGAVPRNYERGRIHPATRTFQALRIYANDELGNLEKTIVSLPRILRKGGRAAIISFHSLEDRIVKNGFREFQKQGTLRLLTKKPIRPQQGEIKENPRSRSAKLRAAVITESRI